MQHIICDPGSRSSTWNKKKTDVNYSIDPSHKHHPDTIHDTHILCSLFPLDILLPTQHILPSPARLLRGICDRQFLHSLVQLSGTDASRPKGILPQGYTQELASTYKLDTAMYWRRV